jgi:hypothetical protein
VSNAVERDPNDDEKAGMAWWNGLSERARALWLQRAASAVAADAWALFKANPGISFEIGVQEGSELARANAGGPALDAASMDLYLAPTGPARH